MKRGGGEDLCSRYRRKATVLGNYVCLTVSQRNGASLAARFTMRHRFNAETIHAHAIDTRHPMPGADFVDVDPIR